MHEYFITKSLVDIVIEEADKVNAVKILEIRIVIGELSSVIDESLQLYFDIIAKDTIAEQAKLVFKKIPVTLECKSCGKKFNKAETGFKCSSCGERLVLLDGGREFYIESIDVE